MHPFSNPWKHQETFRFNGYFLQFSSKIIKVFVLCDGLETPLKLVIFYRFSLNVLNPQSLKSFGMWRNSNILFLLIIFYNHEDILEL